MKAFFIFILISISMLFFSGCMSSKEAARSDSLNVTKATYQHWNEQSPLEFGGRERGTDLVIKLEGWADGHSPEYVIFRNKKSLSAEISEWEDGGVVIKARIVHESDLLDEISKKSDRSNRLVFTAANGEQKFIEIEEWEWINSHKN